MINSYLTMEFDGIWQIFDKKLGLQSCGFQKLCKGVHYVDLGESFQTHIYLQSLASIQPRTSPVKFADDAMAILARPRGSRPGDGPRRGVVHAVCCRPDRDVGGGEGMARPARAARARDLQVSLRGPRNFP